MSLDWNPTYQAFPRKHNVLFNRISENWRCFLKNFLWKVKIFRITYCMNRGKIKEALFIWSLVSIINKDPVFSWVSLRIRWIPESLFVWVLRVIYDIIASFLRQSSLEYLPRLVCRQRYQCDIKCSQIFVQLFERKIGDQGS